jgi:glycine C-acetyltransferase
MNTTFYQRLDSELRAIRDAGTFKNERVINTPQRARIGVEGGGEVLNFCANNYLGLADSPELIAAAKEALDRYGFGMASVRFICGTQTVHKALEAKVASFLGTEEAILFSSCWDANGGLFEVLLGEEDAVVSDALNHASIIDGIRLCKAKRFRYANSDLNDLEGKLKEATASGARHILIATDGVFSMDGVIANLKGIVALAEKYQALTMVDDSHAVGFIGEGGKGTHELNGVMGKIDLLSGTFGKALGGAAGGYVAGRKSAIALLRQRARPYLFSNTVMPAIAHTTFKCIEMLERSGDLRRRLRENSAYFREQMGKLGFKLAGAGHPIIPVMLGDAKLAGQFAEGMLAEGIYVVGFSFPVVPQGQARIRTQMSAAHSREHLDRAIAAFGKVGRALKVI